MRLRRCSMTGRFLSAAGFRSGWWRACLSELKVTLMGAPYVHRLRVRYLECDPQGVVGHPCYLGYFDVAMTEMWRQAIGPWGETVAGGADCVWRRAPCAIWRRPGSTTCST